MTSCPRSVRGALLGLLLVPSALAVVPHRPEGLAPDAAQRLSAPPFVLPAVDADVSKQWAATDPAFRAFVAEAGVEWQARWDARSARLSFAFGTFPRWLPADARVRTPDERAATLAELDARCRALLARHPGLFGVPAGVDLALDPVRSVALDGGRVWQVSYVPEVAGVPVEGGAVFFRINAGRLIQLGQEGLSDALASVPKEHRLTADDAGALGRAEVAALFGGAAPGRIELREAARLAILPWADDPRAFSGAPGTGLQFRAAWRTTWVVEGRLETWEAWHDASTGRRLALRDFNKYACPPPGQPQGRVVGAVYLGPIEEVPESLRGFPYTLVDHGGPVTTDVNGIFPFTPGQQASTSLDGSFFNMDCAGCTNPAQALAATSGWGYLSLGFGGDNTVGNGLSTKAERNCFYHLGIVRQTASKHLDDASTGGFISQLTPATVNIGATCNAFWDGTGVNFFRGGGGCNNTGEIADVMQHEWGHGLDQFTGGGADGARGESIGDTVGFLSTQDARLGPYFVQGDGNGIRNADENVVGVMTASNVGTFCTSVGGGGDGPLGYQVHCESGILTQTWWHLTGNLRQKMVTLGGGEQAGWYLAEKLFFSTLPLSRTYIPAGPQSTYDAVMAVNDDDGDLLNGTPDAAEINDAFTHHEIAPATLVPDAPDCAAPPAPAVTLSSSQLAATGLWQVRVQWTPTPGAVEYRVFRNQAGGGADQQVATVMAPATEFLDDNVTDGVTYAYRVTAFVASGCPSIADNVQTVDVAALPNIALDSWSFDDMANPGGNANNVAEPGETVTIALSALNAAAFPATAVNVELTTTAPGVTIVRGSQIFGDMAPGVVVASAAPHFAVQLDRTAVACGSTIPFSVSFTATEGCSVSGFDLQVGDLPTPCEAPEPRPRLRAEAVVIGDDATFGGTGDASGSADPGELVRLPVDLRNVGNADATSITGVMVLVGGPAGTLVSDASASWVDMTVGALERSSGASAHVEVTVPADAACGDTMDLLLSVAYDGPSGSYTLDLPIPLLVGLAIEPSLHPPGPAPNLDAVDDFELADNGFTHDGLWCDPRFNPCDKWQREVPSAAGNASDPTTAVSGTRAWGTDLGTVGGTQSSGNYRRCSLTWLSTPPIDCSAAAGTSVSFWRWLGVEDGAYDIAEVGVCTDDPATAAVPLPPTGERPGCNAQTPAGDCASYTTLWRNPAGGDTQDTAWTYQEFDLSAVADGRPSVRVVFSINSDPGYSLGGWSIDDLRVFYHDVVCSSSCAAVGPPASPGAAALKATGVKSQTSAEFNWPSAPALGPGESWKLYRGTAPSAVDVDITPADYTGGSFLDANAPDALYFYNLVRANCNGLETP